MISELAPAEFSVIACLFSPCLA